jgi:hypothetical protein
MINGMCMISTKKWLLWHWPPEKLADADNRKEETTLVQNRKGLTLMNWGNEKTKESYATKTLDKRWQQIFRPL